MKKILIFALMIFLILPAISADVITPGFRSIEITNTIENINNYPEYVFISAGERGMPCEIKIIEENGEIPSQYKFCSVSVYAIKNEDFSEEIRSEIIRDYFNPEYNENTAYDTFESLEKIDIIKNVKVYDQVPITSPIKGVNNYYTIDLNQVKEKPDRIDTIGGGMLYIYYLLSIVSLIIIIYILYQRRRKK